MTGPATLHEARTVLGLPPEASRRDVERAFRRCARHAHPDRGGTAEQFAAVVTARELLLTAGGAPVVFVRSRWRRWLDRALASLLRRPPRVR